MAWFRLCRQLGGGLTVAELQNKMSSMEFAEWIQYEAISPGFPERADFHAAQICHRIYMMNKAKSSPILKVKDFVIRFKETSEQKVNSLREKLMAWAGMVSKRKKQ